MNATCGEPSFYRHFVWVADAPSVALKPRISYGGITTKNVDPLRSFVLEIRTTCDSAPIFCGQSDSFPFIPVIGQSYHIFVGDDRREFLEFAILTPNSGSDCEAAQDVTLEGVSGLLESFTYSSRFHSCQGDGPSRWFRLVPPETRIVQARVGNTYS